MSPTKKMLDLCSGLGGASEAFLNHGWEVKRVENNMLLKNVPNTVIMDIFQLETTLENLIATWPDFEQIDFVWCSPPCTDFSVAYSSPRSVAQRNGEDYYPDAAIEMVKCCKRIIDLLQPRYWVIENVSGAATWLNDILGKPTQIVGPFYFWGKFPHIHMPLGFKHSKFTNDTWSSDPLRANKRALVPYEISEAFVKALGEQKSLFYFDD